MLRFALTCLSAALCFALSACALQGPTSAPIEAMDDGSWSAAISSAPEFEAADSEAVLDLGLLELSEGKYLAAFTEGGRLAFWPAREGEPRLLGSLEGQFEAARLDLRRGILAAAGRGRIEVWRIPSMERIAVLQNRVMAHVKSVDIHPDGSAVLLGAGDSRVYRWNFQNPHHAASRHRGQFDLERYIAHATVVEAVQYHPQGRAFVSGDWNGSVYFWKAYDEDLYEGAYDENIFTTGFFTERSTSKRIPRRGGRIEQLLFSDSGEELFFSTNDGTLEIWFVRGLRLAVRENLHKGLIRHFAVSTTGDRLASVGRDGFLRVWEMKEAFDPLQEERTLEIQPVGFIENFPGTEVLFLSPFELVSWGSGDGFERIPLSALNPPEEDPYAERRKKSSRALQQAEPPEEELLQEETGEEVNTEVLP